MLLWFLHNNATRDFTKKLSLPQEVVRVFALHLVSFKKKKSWQRQRWQRGGGGGGEAGWHQMMKWNDYDKVIKCLGSRNKAVGFSSAGEVLLMQEKLELDELMMMVQALGHPAPRVHFHSSSGVSSIQIACWRVCVCVVSWPEEIKPAPVHTRGFDLTHMHEAHTRTELTLRACIRMPGVLVLLVGRPMESSTSR